jgi:hypothetical protein
MYVMEEIGVVNGTFVNDLKLTTGAPSSCATATLARARRDHWHPRA